MTFEETYWALLHRTFSEGVLVDRRGGPTFELLNVGESWPAASAILVNQARAMRMDFAKAEARWIMDGRNDVGPLVKHIKGIAEYSDNGHVLTGAYGPQWVEQRRYVLDTLRANPLSRQAVVSIWRPRPSQSADIPCTLSWQFMQVEGRLDMFVRMRSSDIWLGLPYDAFTWSAILIDTAMALGLEHGNVHYSAATLHLYERNERAAERAYFSLPEAPDFMQFPAFENRDALRLWLNDVQ